MMQFGQKPEGSRLSVDMGLGGGTQRYSGLVGRGQSEEEPESFAALLSRLNNLRQAQGRRKPQRDSHKSPSPGSPGHSSSPAPTAPHLVDRSTTVVPARRRFRTSPRAPAPDALGARKPGVDGGLGLDSGILLSRSGRLCTVEGRAVGTPDIVDSRAPNSVFGAQVDVDMGMGMGHWCRGFVGGELGAAGGRGGAGGYGGVQPERRLKSTRGVRI